MTHLLPFPSEVAVGVAEDQADHQPRQRMARLGGQRLPLRRLRRGVGRVAEQIELTCIAARRKNSSNVSQSPSQTLSAVGLSVSSEIDWLDETMSSKTSSSAKAA